MLRMKLKAGFCWILATTLMLGLNLSHSDCHQLTVYEVAQLGSILRGLHEETISGAQSKLRAIKNTHIPVLKGYMEYMGVEKFDEVQPDASLHSDVNSAISEFKCLNKFFESVSYGYQHISSLWAIKNRSNCLKTAAKPAR